MKVLLTVHQFLPDYFSGTEVLTHSVARELVGRGHEVLVFTGYPARTHMPDHARFDVYDLDGIQVHRFHHAYVKAEGQDSVTEVEYNNLLAASYFARLLNEFQPDFIHFFHFGRLGAALVDAAAAASVPCFFTPTDFWGVCPTSQLLLANGSTCEGPTVTGGNCVRHVAVLNRNDRIGRLARRTPDWLVDLGIAALKLGLTPPRIQNAEILAMSRRRPFIVERLNALNRIVAPTSLMADVLKRNGVHERLIHKSAYGIDLKDIQPRVRSRSSANAPLSVGFIGTLASHKGCLTLVEAFKRLSGKGAIALHVYGNPTDFPDYYARLKNAAGGDASIQFRGTFPSTQMGTVVDGLDVLVVPSLWFENTPLVVYSALASKAPVVASDFPGISEVVSDGHNGMLFPAGNVVALASCLSKLIENPDLLARLSENCQAPKSSGQYVDELISCWQEAPTPTTWRSSQIVTPIATKPSDDYIVGWAVAEKRSPKAIAAYSASGLIGRIRIFSPRPDVRAALRAQGVPISDTAFGFQLVLPPHAERPVVRLELTAASGTVFAAPIEKFRKGVSFEISDQVYFGVDDLRLTPPSGPGEHLTTAAAHSSAHSATDSCAY